MNFLTRYPYLTYLRAEHQFRTSSDIKLLGALVVLLSFEASRTAILRWFGYFILLARLGFSFTFNDQRDIYELSFISSIAILVWIITAKFPVFYLKTEIRVNPLCLNSSLFETKLQTSTLSAILNSNVYNRSLDCTQACCKAREKRFN